jgi:hypothetical protein
MRVLRVQDGPSADRERWRKPSGIKGQVSAHKGMGPNPCLAEPTGGQLVARSKVQYRPASFLQWQVSAHWGTGPIPRGSRSEEPARAEG